MTATLSLDIVTSKQTKPHQRRQPTARNAHEDNLYMKRPPTHRSRAIRIQFYAEQTTDIPVHVY